MRDQLCELREEDMGTGEGPEVRSAAFDGFCAALAGVMGEDAWAAWGRGLRYREEPDDTVSVVAGTQLQMDRIQDAAGGPRKVRALWSRNDPFRRSMRVKVDDPQTGDAVALTPDAPITGPAKTPPPRGDNARTFDNFVVGPANKHAHAAAKALVSSDRPPFQVGLIHGAQGSGKSHLLRAVEAAANAKESGSALYYSADRFREAFTRALREKTGHAFKDALRQTKILLIDDMHLLDKSKQTQIELHNAVVDMIAEGGRVLIAADRPAEEIKDLDARLRQRLAGAVSTGVAKPDLDLRRRILEAMARQNPAVTPGAIGPDVLDFMASASPDKTPRELEGLLGTLITRTILVGEAVTLDAARAVSVEAFSGPSRKVSVEDIQKAVAAFHGMKVAELLSPRRSKDVVRPRQEAMYLCKEFTQRSLPDIGRRFGGKDHTTVMHAVKRIKSLMDEDNAIRTDIESLRRILSRGRDAVA